MFGRFIGLGIDIAKVATSGTPVGAAIAVIDHVVDNMKDDNVSNTSVVKLLESAGKSIGNTLTPKKIQIITKILTKDDKDLEEIERLL